MYANDLHSWYVYSFMYNVGNAFLALAYLGTDGALASVTAIHLRMLDHRTERWAEDRNSGALA